MFCYAANDLAIFFNLLMIEAHLYFLLKSHSFIIYIKPVERVKALNIGGGTLANLGQ